MVQERVVIRGFFLCWVARTFVGIPAVKRECSSRHLEVIDEFAAKQNTKVDFFSIFSAGDMSAEEQAGMNRGDIPNSPAYKIVHTGGDPGPWIVGSPIEDIHHQGMDFLDYNSGTLE